MTSNEGFRKYIEAGAVLGQVTRARAEEIVRELVSAGQVQGGQAQTWVDDLVDRSRKASEDLLQLVRTEVSTQLTAIGLDPEDLAKQVADILRHSADIGRQATKEAASRAGAAARAGSAKRPGAKKAAAKAGGTKKAAPKKAATKKAAAPKTATAKKAGTTKKAAAKKATATKKAAAPKTATAEPSAGNGSAGTGS